MAKKTTKLSQVLNQARESLKLLETIEKETLAKARTFVSKPLRGDRRKQTNERILASLRTLGVATRSEVEALELRVEQLSQELAASKKPRGSAPKAQATPHKGAESEAFPNT